MSRTVQQAQVENWREGIRAIADGPKGDALRAAATEEDRTKALDTFSDDEVAALYGCVTRMTKELVPGIEGRGGLSPEAVAAVKAYATVQ
mmetsp:Transcript_20072/g.47876  ORF Transcript_20072/g.47876 Transcript_20072/m.47876 type:complete len:90 (+) Transcript_20072:112-381(+)|eukprot:CAMPEP_0175826352 /NCGR_PEP_ID=MMETSP0107_2-20121207/11722_1 /TAXON_ID=195067 ORGANISM="Goniomonas pacifica, Strain CCMP1869" /NCGR_SAMPLE_ID=MMETSP0107_2 /ASSEMBLY_ACC=CAM_ASM_000203 /LENGTH=89 /DNA_ID=CAMNT_0017138991 /DNA_START=212 /DNA_END=481 /DNA_ORIENTATION=+